MLQKLRVRESDKQASLTFQETRQTQIDVGNQISGEEFSLQLIHQTRSNIQVEVYVVFASGGYDPCCYG